MKAAQHVAVAKMFANWPNAFIAGTNCNSIHLWLPVIGLELQGVTRLALSVLLELVLARMAARVRLPAHIGLCSQHFSLLIYVFTHTRTHLAGSVTWLSGVHLRGACA
ncbi:hypothetical protein BST61_g11438 [Cercospora zeina]